MTTPAFGLLNINKPQWLTSRKVVDRVVKLVRPAKAGHAGTLDPLATGVLVVCVGSATRLISHVQHGRKSYRATFLFGRRSDTDDVTGNVIETAGVIPVARGELEALLPRFIGRIEQVPPQFSAVHVDGKRAYKLARAGEAVEIKPRTVEVESITIRRFEFPEVELDIDCGSGTYIRSIGRDLGDALGCGAVMSALVRTAVGPFQLAAAIDLDDLSSDTLSDALLPAVTAVTGLPQVHCTPEDEQHLRHGRRIRAAEDCTLSDGETIAVITSAGQLACIARYEPDNGAIAPKHVFLEQLAATGSSS